MPRIPAFYLAAAAVVIAATPAVASSFGSPQAAGGTTYVEGSVMTYEVFEASVPHVDLAECPADLDQDAVFCRATLAAEQMNIFVFAFGGDQKLIAVRHLPLEEGVINY